MSPYQQQVIDTTLADFDRQAQMQEQRIADQSSKLLVRLVVQDKVYAESEFRAGSDRNRAALQAGLLQQGFGQSQALAAQRFGESNGISGYATTITKSRCINFRSAGRARQRVNTSSGLDATREANRMAAFQPQEQVDRYANIVTGIMGGYPGQTQTTNIPNPTPLQNALAIASTGAGIYKALGQGSAGFNNVTSNEQNA